MLEDHFSPKTFQAPRHCRFRQMGAVAHYRVRRCRLWRCTSRAPPIQGAQQVVKGKVLPRERQTVDQGQACASSQARADAASLRPARV